MRVSMYIVIAIAVVILALALLWKQNQFLLPQGSTSKVTENEQTLSQPSAVANKTVNNQESSREVFVTDGVQHSIPISEILSGGPPKDGIPSIDNPKFISTKEADFLNNEDIGLGLIDGDAVKFYPYQILVWHEVVNDENVLVTYCPLCGTGIAFDPRVNGEHIEFGVSGKLWQSNLLMYNRTNDERTESLWSQILGEAVLGPLTGTKLKIVSSDTVLYGDWKKQHPDTLVLSRDTGALRTYGFDPYSSYYTNDTVSFGATFADSRLHPKTLVLGVELNGSFKAYPVDTLSEGITEDTIADTIVTIEKDEFNRVRMFTVDSESETRIEIPYIRGFWFSWLAVHPNTKLFN